MISNLKSAKRRDNRNKIQNELTYIEVKNKNLGELLKFIDNQNNKWLPQLF